MLAALALVAGISSAGADLIVRWEVISPQHYAARLERPVCPVCYKTPSGITIGIGNDLGHTTLGIFEQVWQGHPQRADLLPVIGLRGAEAQRALPSVAHVRTPYALAWRVFADIDLVNAWRICRRAFGPMYATAQQVVIDALGSVCHNRGGAMGGPARVEMRAIRDVCLPARDALCTARQIREMKRLWSDVGGLRDRRDSEAAYIERGLRHEQAYKQTSIRQNRLLREQEGCR